MAGDSIVVTVGLARRRELLVLARESGQSRHEVAGLLVDFWGWLSEETADGFIAGVTRESLALAIGADERFWSLLEDVGWAEFRDDGLRIPGWENWLEESAKERVASRRRKRGRGAPAGRTSGKGASGGGASGDRAAPGRRSRCGRGGASRAAHDDNVPARASGAYDDSGVPAGKNGTRDNDGVPAGAGGAHDNDGVPAGPPAVGAGGAGDGDGARAVAARGADGDDGGSPARPRAVRAGGNTRDDDRAPTDCGNRPGDDVARTVAARTASARAHKDVRASRSAPREAPESDPPDPGTSSENPKTPRRPDRVPPELADLPLYREDRKLCARFDELVRAWSQANPRVDVLATIRRAHAWEVSNPRRRKRDRAKFLERWIAREEDRARGPPVTWASRSGRPHVAPPAGRVSSWADPEEYRIEPRTPG